MCLKTLCKLKNRYEGCKGLIHHYRSDGIDPGSMLDHRAGRAWGAASI